MTLEPRQRRCLDTVVTVFCLVIFAAWVVCRAMGCQEGPSVFPPKDAGPADNSRPLEETDRP